MFHVKHLFTRRPRPRILGERHPHYSRSALEHFTELGSAATRAVIARSDKDREQALFDLDTALLVSNLYANNVLLEIIENYGLVVQAYTRGDADRAQVGEAQSAYYEACREALGTND